MNVKDELKEYFKDIEEGKRQIAYDCIEDYVFFQEQIAMLKKLPLIRVHATNPQKQQTTPAAKLIKEYSQAVDNKRKTLLMILYRNETSAADELLKKLSEFE